MNSRLSRNLIIFAAMTIWLTACFGDKTLRPQTYKALIHDFQKAAIREERTTRDRDYRWDFQIVINKSNTSARIFAADSFGVAHIHYSDEKGFRNIFDAGDYKHTRQIRIANDVLYVYWTQTMFHTDRYLTSYDLKNRREIVSVQLEEEDLVLIR